MKASFIKKGFTLIELMIVIVILGVLMSTILPKLTGAQARARDAGRVADLRNIESALQVYFDDKGAFPKSTGECLPETSTETTIGNNGYVTNAIKSYLKGNKVPQDPLKKANTTLCSTSGQEGRYWYRSIQKNGVNKSSFVLCADMESYQKANTLIDDSSGLKISEATFEGTNGAGAKVGNHSFTADDATASKSVYCITL